MNKPLINKTALAREVGRDKSQISRYIQRDDWLFGPGPWKRNKLPEILRWVADSVREKEDVTPLATRPPPDKGTVSLRRSKLINEVRRLEAQASRIEMAIAREQGKLLAASEVGAAWAGIGANVRNGFQNLPSTLVPLAMRHGMPHTSATAFQSEAESLIAAILTKLASEGSGADGERA